MSQPESKSYEDVEAAQELLSAAGLNHWQVVPIHGAHGDPFGYFKASRVAPGGIREVTHREARVLLRLAQEVDARLNSTPQGAAVVTSGTTDTNTHAGG